MQRIRIRSRQGGFSLNEALISMTILSSGLLGLAQFQGEMVQHGGETRTRSSALAVVQHKLEELRERAATDYDAIQTGSDSPTQSSTGQATFSRIWNVTPHDDPAYKQVEVTAAWTSIENQRESIRLVSLIAPSTAYSAQPNDDRSLQPEPAEDATPPTEETNPAATNDSNASMETAPEDVAAAPQEATCLCRQDSDGSTRLDSRSSDSNCSQTCCQTTANSLGGTTCGVDDCSFVAQCL